MFSKLKIPISGGFFFLAATSALFFGLTYKPIFSASKADCEIYRVLEKEFFTRFESDSLFFRPSTVIVNNFNDWGEVSSVQTLRHRTEEVEVIPASSSFESYESYKYETVVVDLTDVDWEFDTTPYRLKNCFNERDKFEFSTLTLSALLTRERVRRNSTEVWPEIWGVSQIVRSADKRYAVIYDTLECDGFCGGGGYYVLERDETGWVILGYKTIWVS